MASLKTRTTSVLLCISMFILLCSAKNQVHREIELQWDDIASIAFTVLAIMLAAGGGIGGGCLMVPILIIVMRFDPKVAIPISSAGVLGASLANLVINWRKRHPVADRPLVSWDIILMMEPLTVFGTVLGSYINIVCPSWLLVIMLVVLLGSTSTKILSKARRMWNRETIELRDTLLRDNERKSTQIDVEDYSVGYDPLTGGSVISKDASVQWERQANDIRNATQESQLDDTSHIAESERHHSWTVITAIVCLNIGVFVLAIAKGNSDFNLFDIHCGSWQYWAIALAVLPLASSIYSFSRWYSLRLYYIKENLIKHNQYEYQIGDVRWNPRNTIVYPIICSVAGIVAGLFGIGGGVVKGPLMLEMGVLPSVASATSATMIIFTSSAATLQYALFNALNYYFAIAFFCIGFVSAFLGRTGLNVLVSKYDRPSLIVIIIGCTVGLSALGMGANFIIENLIGHHKSESSHICE